MAKLKQKVFGCLRTMTGALQFCAIRSYLSTAAKQGLSFFDALVMLAKGEPWMPIAACQLLRRDVRSCRREGRSVAEPKTAGRRDAGSPPARGRPRARRSPEGISQRNPVMCLA